MIIIPDILVFFVKNSVSHFDESHNLDHAIAVTNRSHEIMKSLQSDYDSDLLSYMAMLHDVRDHKYPESITEEDLKIFIKTQLGDKKLEQVMFIIENLSWSKESKGLRETPPPEISNYLIAVSDADRLEAIGEIGIKRCYNFAKAKYSGYTHEQLVKRVIDHSNEKLLKLYNEYFIVSDHARKIAFPLHQEIIKFLESPESFVFCKK